MSINLLPNLDDADGAYADLISVHKSRSEADSNALNARLILILMNHIGERAILREALTLAASGLAGP
jgi:hypothetical protein